MNLIASLPVPVTPESFPITVLAASHHQPVLVDFWAAWCGPCRVLAGPLEEIAAERTGRDLIAKVDIQAHPELATRFHLRSIPALLIFRHGAVVDSLFGVQSKSVILEHLDAAAGFIPVAASA